MLLKFLKLEVKSCKLKLRTLSTSTVQSLPHFQLESFKCNLSADSSGEIARVSRDSGNEIEFKFYNLMDRLPIRDIATTSRDGAYWCPLEGVH